MKTEVAFSALGQRAGKLLGLDIVSKHGDILGQSERPRTLQDPIKRELFSHSTAKGMDQQRG